MENRSISKECEDVISISPSWMFKWGTSILVLIIVSCVVLSCLISYPDLIQANSSVIIENQDQITIKLVMSSDGVKKIKLGNTLEVKIIDSTLKKEFSFLGTVTKISIDSIQRQTIGLEVFEEFRPIRDKISHIELLNQSKANVFGKKISLFTRIFSKLEF